MAKESNRGLSCKSWDQFCTMSLSVSDMRGKVSLRQIHVCACQHGLVLCKLIMGQPMGGSGGGGGVCVCVYAVEGI